jgi:hypothetical protein
MEERLSRVLLLTIMALSMLTGLAAGEVKLTKGQTLYVPCYKSFISGGLSHDIKATIFLHNTDPNNSINIERIDFYNTSGKLVAKYLQQPLKLNALAATHINVKEPLKGEEGSGAHLIIKWQAENKVVEPLVESWFLGAAGTRGYSFSSQARIIQEDAN